MAITSAEHIKIFRITLESPRANKPIVLATSNSQSTIVNDINIFENISLPYLTGNISILDDNDIYSFLNLLGSEKITISYGLDTTEYEPITKTFILTNIIKSEKINDNSTMLVMNMIEDVGYYNFVKKFSKTYDGAGEQIVQSIITDQIDKPIYTEMFEPSYQAAFRYIVPYLNPFEAVSNVLGKMTTKTGMPYFFYSSLARDGFVLSDLESILKAGAFNRGNPLTLSQSMTSSPSISKYAFAMHDFTNTSNLEDSLRMIQKGAVGAELHVVNAHTGDSLRGGVIDNTNVYQLLVNYNIISKDQAIEHVDYFFKPDPNEKDDRTLRQFSSKIFTDIQSIPYPLSNLNGYSQETYYSDTVLKMIKKSVIQHLLKNVYVFNMPGLLFTGNNPQTSVGNLVEINIPSSTIPDGRRTNMIDQKRSGNFLILAKRHFIKVAEKRHNVAIEVGRVTNLENTR